MFLFIVVYVLLLQKAAGGTASRGRPKKVKVSTEVNVGCFAKEINQFCCNTSIGCTKKRTVVTSRCNFSKMT